MNTFPMKITRNKILILYRVDDKDGKRNVRGVKCTDTDEE